MTRRARMPGGEPRKASQRQRRLAAPSRVVVERSWRPGDKVRWRNHSGTYLRDAEGGQAEVLIRKRTYRVVVGKLQPA